MHNPTIYLIWLYHEVRQTYTDINMDSLHLNIYRHMSS